LPVLELFLELERATSWEAFPFLQEHVGWACILLPVGKLMGAGTALWLLLGRLWQCYDCFMVGFQAEQDSPYQILQGPTSWAAFTFILGWKVGTGCLQTTWESSAGADGSTIEQTWDPSCQPN
jgi:hypothetical protein